jgi:hypothetical protein
MKTPIEILLEKGVISELTFNPGHYEYRSDDPQKILFAIEAYANQFKPSITRGNIPALSSYDKYLRVRSVLFMMHSEMKTRNFSDGSLRWYIPAYIIEFMQSKHYFDQLDSSGVSTALFDIPMYENYQNTLVLCSVGEINDKPENTIIVHDFLEQQYKVDIF